MSEPISLPHAWNLFEKLGNASQTAFIKRLNDGGHLESVKDRAIAPVRQQARVMQEQINTLNERVKHLEIQKAAILRHAANRLTRADRKARIVELDDEGWTSCEIAKRMTADGEPISAPAVRQCLSRLRRKK